MLDAPESETYDFSMANWNWRGPLFALVVSTLVLGSGATAQAQDDDDEGSAAKPAKQHQVDTGDETTGMSTGAQTDGEKAAVKAASDLLTQYLDLVKGKKWDKAKTLTHPLTLKSIASTKKRLGEERHSMAPWFWAKGSFYLTNYKVQDALPAVGGTVVVRTVEDSFQVEEKGELTGEKEAYLLGKKDGKWYVVDKKSNADGFTKDAIKFGYPGYFDK
jgi:hypothetical protein